VWQNNFFFKFCSGSPTFCPSFALAVCAKTDRHGSFDTIPASDFQTCMSTVDYQLSSALCLRDNKTAMMGVKTAGDSRPKPWTPVSLTIPGSTPKPTAGPTICGRHGI